MNGISTEFCCAFHITCVVVQFRTNCYKYWWMWLNVCMYMSVHTKYEMKMIELLLNLNACYRIRLDQMNERPEHTIRWCVHTSSHGFLPWCIHSFPMGCILCHAVNMYFNIKLIVLVPARFEITLLCASGLMIFRNKNNNKECCHISRPESKFQNKQYFDN